MDDTFAVESGTCALCHGILLSELEALTSICALCKLLYLDESERTHGGSTRWRRISSDTESDSFDSVSRDNIFPYSDSDVSVNVNNHPHDTDTNTDIDIDTDHMYVGMNHWNFDDDDDETENRDRSLVGGARLRRSLATNGRNLSVDWLREILSPEGEIGISERRGIAEEYFDGEINRVGPRASVSFVKNLERVTVGNDDDVEGLVCVICKDSVCVGSVVNRLPCLHVYHPSCIMQWLNVHNTCPLCRYELPIDGDKNRTHGLVGPENVRGVGGGGGGGRGWWWFVVAPLVSVVGIGLMLCFGVGGIRGSS